MSVLNLLTAPLFLLSPSKSAFSNASLAGRLPFPNKGGIGGIPNEFLWIGTGALYMDLATGIIACATSCEVEEGATASEYRLLCSGGLPHKMEVGDEAG
jgi:hypothetical protein